MNKVYVIMQGEYSDKEVVGISYNLELAKAICKVHNVESNDYYDYWIWDEEGTLVYTDENFKVQAEGIETAFVYNITATIKGGVMKWDTSYIHMHGIQQDERTASTAPKIVAEKDNDLKGKLHVYAEDEAVADKIACDYLAKVNAELVENPKTIVNVSFEPEAPRLTLQECLSALTTGSNIEMKVKFRE